MAKHAGGHQSRIDVGGNDRLLVFDAVLDARIFIDPVQADQQAQSRNIGKQRVYGRVPHQIDRLVMDEMGRLGNFDEHVRGPVVNVIIRHLDRNVGNQNHGDIAADLPHFRRVVEGINQQHDPGRQVYRIQDESQRMQSLVHRHDRLRAHDSGIQLIVQVRVNRRVIHDHLDQARYRQYRQQPYSPLQLHVEGEINSRAQASVQENNRREIQQTDQAEPGNRQKHELVLQIAADAEIVFQTVVIVSILRHVYNEAGNNNQIGEAHEQHK
ncbi:hypothetical protein D3C74_226540 [compost metagenome]